MKLDIAQRRAGVLVPVFALRTSTDLGVGDTGGVRRMVNWCRQLGLSILQVLPVNETSDDNSPYNAISSLALDYTTLEISPGLIPGLTEEDFANIATPERVEPLRLGPVQYKKVKTLKKELLECAFENFKTSRGQTKPRKDFARFRDEEGTWLIDYSYFRALADQHATPVWEQWPPEHRSPQAVNHWLENLPADSRDHFLWRAEYYCFVQWLLHEQWDSVKNEAQAQGVFLMGDMPFGVSRYSADTWANPEWFDMNWCVGAPPEPFFKDSDFTRLWGQNWGMPLYKWDTMKEGDYAWWRRRVRGVSRCFHLFRIDHVLGFFRVYAFPWLPQDNEKYTHLTRDEVEEMLGRLPGFLPGDDSVPLEAMKNQELGEEFLQMVIEAAGNTSVIGEDLGVVPPYVRPTLTELGIAGFKIPLFDRIWGGEYEDPTGYPQLSVATLATHDHDTMLAVWERWWSLYEEMEKRRAAGTLTPEFEKEATEASWELYRTQRFAKLDDSMLIRPFEPVVREGILRSLFYSNSWLAIPLICDLLSLDLRFNVPGPVAESNWSERLPWTMDELENLPDLESKRVFLRKLVEDTGRMAAV